MPDWPHKSANHIIQAVGSSSIEKCKDFATNIITSANPPIQPSLYGSYDEVFKDINVDCVYIGSPHSFHKQHCLQAIEAGKNVLCEKPFAMNSREAEEVFTAAKAKGVFIMEAMWTRFFPAFQQLHRVLHSEKKLGQIHRVFCDFGLHIDIQNLPADNRYKDPALGAGSLLDLGVYSLTWGLMTLDLILKDTSEDLEVSSSQSIVDGVDVTSTIVLHDRKTGGQAICTSTTNVEPRRPDRSFARIEGSKGSITVHGNTAASPDTFVFHPKDGGQEETYRFEKPGMGFYWEADAVARDLQAGRKQSQVMPWWETVRVMQIMDNVRKRGGARFPVDDW